MLFTQKSRNRSIITAGHFPSLQHGYQPSGSKNAGNFLTI
jgi:hypothetical protein